MWIKLSQSAQLRFRMAFLFQNAALSVSEFCVLISERRFGPRSLAFQSQKVVSIFTMQFLFRNFDGHPVPVYQPTPLIALFSLPACGTAVKSWLRPCQKPKPEVDFQLRGGHLEKSVCRHNFATSGPVWIKFDR